jgi:CHASE1-domain containing sensor protein
MRLGGAGARLGLWTLANLMLAVCYLLAGALVVWLGRVSGIAIPLWPAAGLAFVCLLRWGVALLPGVLAGALVINVLDLASGGWSLGHLAFLSAIPAAGSALQALAGAWMVQRWVGTSPILSKPREIILFIGMGGPLSCVIAPALGVTTLVLGGVLSSGDAMREALVWWVGDSIGVIVFAPLLLMSLPGQAANWRGRQWLVALPSLLISTLILGLFLHYGNLQRQQMVRSLERAAERAESLLQAKLTWQEGALYALKGLFETIDPVGQSDFHTFTLPILENTGGLVALSWNPLVTSGHRLAFEQRLQKEYADLSLRIRERRDGRMQPAVAYASHVVVELIEPFARNRQALGYDIQSDPIRAKALHRAAEDGSVQATAPIQLVQSKQVQLGMLKVLPVYCASGSARSDADHCRDVRGFVVGVFQLQDLFDTTFTGPAWDEVHLHLNDVTEAEETVDIASSPQDQETMASTFGFGRQRHLLVSRRQFNQAGRRWELEVHPKRAFFLRRQTVFRESVLLLAAVSLAALLEALLLLITGIELEARRDLEKRLRLSLTTSALAHEIKHPLAALLLESKKIAQLAVTGELRENTRELQDTVLEMQENCLSVSRAITAVQQLLSHCSTDYVLLDLVDLVCNALLIVKSDAMNRGIHLQSRGLDQPRILSGDPAQLQLIVINLLRNSLEATPSGGVVEAALEVNREWLELRVSDSGPGFATNPGDPDRLPLSSPKSEGFGLGLYMVRIAAENHGAKIHFGRSRLGGAEVVVCFPARSLRRSRHSKAG